VILGCGGDSDAEVEPSGTDTGESQTGGTETGAEDPPGATGTGDDTGSSEPLPEAPLAGGISITDIEINQAVGLWLAKDGNLVDPGARAAPVISNRPALIRAAWALEPDFTPREIVGELVITQSDGTSEAGRVTRHVQGPPIWSTQEGTFRWLLPAELVQDGTRFAVSLLESGDETEGELQSPRFPAEGEAEVGAWPDLMQLNLVIVPYETGCGPAEREWTDQIVADYSAFMYSVYPINELNLVIHDSIQVAPNCEYDNNGLDQLAQLRAQENLGPNWYYQGMFTVENTPNDYPGYSYLLGPGKDELRIGWAEWWAHTPGDISAHELAHNHGRQHAFNDPAYEPASGADFGGRERWGFGVKTGRLPGKPDPPDQIQRMYPPNMTGSGKWHDFTSYSYQQWVSAYTFAGLAERIRITSKWSEEQGGGRRPASDRTRSLAGFIDRNGRISWALLPGRASSPASDEPAAAIVRLSGHRIAARTYRDDHGNPTAIHLTLPDDLELSADMILEATIDHETYRAVGSDVRGVTG
jgi:hypothetical protein